MYVGSYAVVILLKVHCIYAASLINVCQISIDHSVVTPDLCELNTMASELIDRVVTCLVSLCSQMTFMRLY